MPHDHNHDCPACAGPDLAFATHDHAHCAQDVLARADALAANAGVRFTPVRRRVLEILLEGHRALGAYDVLNRLVAEGFGNQPPVAYRALDFLVEQGLAHRIQRLNAFAACMHPGENHSPVFLICGTCNAVSETPADAVLDALTQVAQAADFTLDRSYVELVGQCPTCRGAAQ